jgi:hypothetical protein
MAAAAVHILCVFFPLAEFMSLPFSLLKSSTYVMSSIPSFLLLLLLLLLLLIRFFFFFSFLRRPPLECGTKFSVAFLPGGGRGREGSWFFFF